VTALDQRRVLEVWPGGDDAIRTWDGLAAESELDGDRVALHLESETARPVEVRFLGRTLDGLTVPGARVRIDDGTGSTVVSLPALEGRLTISWDGGSP